MKYIILFLCLISYNSYSQQAMPEIVDEKSIIKCTLRKKGIYKTFNEFKYNNPSDTSSAYEVRIANNDPDRYWVYSINNGEKTKIKRGIWGYCDGEDVYVHVKQFSMNLWYVKVIDYGKVCICTDMVTSNTGIIFGAIGGVVGGAVGGAVVGAIGAAIQVSKGKERKYYDLFGLNIKDGQFYFLTPENIENKILSLDKELKFDYQHDDDKKKKALEYLIEFNNRYELSHPEYWK